MFDERKPLGKILVDLQVMTPAEVERVLEAMRRRRDHTKFGQVARDMGLSARRTHSRRARRADATVSAHSRDESESTA